MTAEFIAAWNKNDSKTLANCFTTDGDLINPAGRVGRGRNEVEKIVTDEQNGVFKGTRISMQQKHLRFLKPDVAVADYEYEITGLKGPQTTLKGLLTSVLRKEHDKWLITAGRPTVPAQLPVSNR